MEIFIDGACQGNPGPAAAAFIVRRNGEDLMRRSRFLGAATNNIAEYTALIDALQEALAQQWPDIEIYTDSELLHRQLTGVYRVRDNKLKSLFEQVRRLMAGFRCCQVHHVRREHNQDADRLAKEAIKQAGAADNNT